MGRTLYCAWCGGYHVYPGRVGSCEEYLENLKGGRIMNFYDDLCYRCKEQRTARGWVTVVGDHCHHEPREKPVSKCRVCRDGSFSVAVTGWGWSSPMLARFCPECGRSLT